MAGVAALGALAAVAVAALTVPPSWFPPCPFHAATGLWCPGCGSGRALIAARHGDVAAVVAHNPALIVVAPWLTYVAVRWISARLRGRARPSRPARPWVVPVTAVAIVGYWVARNLPWAPFTGLAP